MSKDWTPQELYHADKWMVANGWGSHRVNKPKYYDMATGEEVETVSQAEIDAGKAFQEVSFLFGDWYQTYLHTDESVRDDVFRYIDKLLIKVIDDTENNRIVIDSHDYDVVKAWYLGKLDPMFYYNNRNNAAFVEFIEDVIADKRYVNK